MLYRREFWALRHRSRIFCALIVAGCVLAVSTGLAQSPSLRQRFDAALDAQHRGDNAAAAAQYQVLLRLDPTMTAAHANLAGALVALKRYNEAIAQYKVALKEVPGNRALELALAIAYFRKGDFETAGRKFASLHWDDPTDIRATTLLAECDTHLGRYNEAISLLKPLESADSHDLDLEWALGSALIRAGHTRQGLLRIQKVAELGHNVEAYQTAANLYLGLTYFDLARRDAEAVIRLNPRISQAYVVLGMVKDYSGDETGASGEFEKALQIDPKNLQARIQLGSVLYTQRKLREAQRQLLLALAQDPGSSSAHYLLARVERLHGDLPAALNNLQIAERQDPQWLSPHVDLVALYYALKRPADGAREKAIVDHLMATARQRHSATRVILPTVPAP